MEKIHAGLWVLVRRFYWQCVFSASTNLSEYLGDETGGRRFWPVVCRGIDVTALHRDRDQLWAEAVAAHKTGEAWHIVDEDMKSAAEDDQATRIEQDPWEEVISEWLSQQHNAGCISGKEILDRAIGVKPVDMDQKRLRRLGNIMRRLGYERSPCRVGGRVVKGWKLSTI